MQKLLKKLFRVPKPGRHVIFHGGQIDWIDDAPDYKAHLAGEKHLCIVPIGGENKCCWGALDIDAHGDEKPINTDALKFLVKDYNLPLNLYYSKSGKGVHAYLFLDDETSAENIRGTLSLYATVINSVVPNPIEVFPKQNELSGDGNCIRIPYFGNICKPLFDEKPRVRSVPMLPFCLLHSPAEGDRNNYIYHLTNFLHLQKVEKVAEVVRIINDSWDDPLSKDEVERTRKSASRLRNEYDKKGGYGLGCTYCPTKRKSACKFSKQLNRAEIDGLMDLTILQYMSKPAQVQLKVGDQAHIFDRRDVLDPQIVRHTFTLDYGVRDIPKMARKDWVGLIDDLFEEAPIVSAVDPSDKGHYIVSKLAEWSNKFKTGIENVYGGAPVFISKDHFMVLPDDLFQRFMAIGVYGISREEILSTLEKIGHRVIIGNMPAYKVPTDILRIEGEVVVPAVTVNNIDPDEIQYVPGPTVKLLNKLGVEITLTDEFLEANPSVQQRIIENTKSPIEDIGF